MLSSFIVQQFTRAISRTPSIRAYSVQNGKLRTLSLPIRGKKLNHVNAHDALKLVKSGSSVFVHGFSATPTLLLEHLCQHVESGSISDLRLTHILINGPVPWDSEKFYGKITSNCLFISDGLREMVNRGQADYTPVFLSEVPRLYSSFEIPVDVALINVSPTDSHGFCSLGIVIDGTYDALRAAKVIIAIENDRMPRTFGDTQIHVTQIDALVRESREIHSKEPMDRCEGADATIGRFIADQLVDDGSTIQIGLGTIPDAALSAMQNHKNLGVHTELLGDGVMDLVQSGVITNSDKSTDPGKIVTTIALGSRKLYDFIDNNPLFLFKSSAYTNGYSVIGSQHKMVAINSAIEVDITGQCVSESIGSKFYSGFGGQLDFIYGTASARDGLGKSIIALPSTTKRGQSKIVPTIKEGAGVVVTRGHVRYVVTEYGIAQIWGKSVRQRAYELIKIAHPDHREALEKAAFARLKCMPCSN